LTSASDFKHDGQVHSTPQICSAETNAGSKQLVLYTKCFGHLSFIVIKAQPKVYRQASFSSLPWFVLGWFSEIPRKYIKAE
jgi:hypothetical protein